MNCFKSKWPIKMMKGDCDGGGLKSVDIATVSRVVNGTEGSNDGGV